MNPIPDLALTVEEVTKLFGFMDDADFTGWVDFDNPLDVSVLGKFQVYMAKYVTPQDPPATT